jgi:hypothetical protein
MIARRNFREMAMFSWEARLLRILLLMMIVVVVVVMLVVGSCLPHYHGEGHRR